MFNEKVLYIPLKNKHGHFLKRKLMTKITYNNLRDIHIGHRLISNLSNRFG